MTSKHVNTPSAKTEVVKKEKVLGGRFEQQEYRRVRIAAAERDLTVSEFVRRAVLRFLDHAA